MIVIYLLYLYKIDFSIIAQIFKVGSIYID